MGKAEKDLFRRFCGERQTVSLFQQHWWLDTVCGEENWDVVLVEHGGEIAGALPYYSRSRFGLASITMPDLTQFMGPILVYPKDAKQHSRLSFDREVLGALIDRLPTTASYYQRLHHSLTNWLPYYWRGFRQTTRYTYVLPDLHDLESLFDGVRSNIRREIRKARSRVEVVSTGDIAEFHRMNRLTFRRQGKIVPYTFEFVSRLDAACAERGCRKILLATDSEGRVHAGVYIVWGPRTAYYLMGGGDPALRNSGAMSLLMWEAIRHAAEVAEEFDFEGSMMAPVERFFAAFGALQFPYFEISRRAGLPDIVRQLCGRKLPPRRAPA